MRSSIAIPPLYLASALLATSTLQPPPELDAQMRLLGDDRLHSTAPSGPQKPKNVIFILTDDQDAVLDSVKYMPRLNKHVADKGTSFVNHFTTTAICCPARVALWTGKQPHNTNVTDVNYPYGGYVKFVEEGHNENYLPVWLQEAGYETYYAGKLFNGHSTSNYDKPYPAAWTGTNFLLDPGTYAYLNPIYQQDKKPPKRHKDTHTSTLFNDYAKDLVGDAISSNKPFFVGLAPVAPHSNVDAVGGGVPFMTEPIPLERHADLFPGVKIPRTENFNPDTPSGVSYVRQLKQHNESSVAYLDHFYRARLRALQAVDELVEQVVEQLDAAGLLDDTYIIYSSDNGYHLGHHRLPAGKECGFDEDIRVPLIVRGPGVAKGAVSKAVTTHIDLAPTLLKLMGIDLREDFDGTPIPVFQKDEEENEAVVKHEHVAVEFWGAAIAEGETGGYNGNIKAPNNTYKGVRIVHKNYDLYYSVWCSGEHELYNVKEDPGQMKNLYPRSGNVVAGNGQYLGTSVSNVVNRLDALMMVLKSCKGEVCILPWNILHPDGDVASLKDALSPKYDQFYEEQVKVKFDRCENGYIVGAEGPQVGYQYRDGLEWHHWT